MIELPCKCAHPERDHDGRCGWPGCPCEWFVLDVNPGSHR